VFKVLRIIANGGIDAIAELISMTLNTDIDHNRNTISMLTLDEFNFKTFCKELLDAVTRVKRDDTLVFKTITEQIQQVMRK
jgi:hypothetical protein